MAKRRSRYRWHQVERTLAEDAHVDRLEADLRALDTDLSRVAIDLEIAGTLSPGPPAI